MNKKITIIISFCLSFLFLINVAFVVAIAKEKKYSKIDNLSYRTIYIDPGHGGKDNGASVENVLEDNINMKISGYLMELLIDSNNRVLISRTGDYDLASVYQKNRKKEDLKNRVNYINDSNPDIFISIHLNTFSSSSVNGGQTFYQNNEKSKNLADCIQNEFNQLSSLNKKAKLGDYYILNNTKPIGVLLECGFLSNPEDRKNLNNENYQRKVANTIYKGIIKYFSYMY